MLEKEFKLTSGFLYHGNSKARRNMPSLLGSIFHCLGIILAVITEHEENSYTELIQQQKSKNGNSSTVEMLF